MQEEIQKLRERALQELQVLEGNEGLAEWKVRYLGKKGEVTALLRGMGALSPEERPRVGSLVNELREELETAHEQRENQAKEAARNQRLQNESIDITLPGRTLPVGTLHPLAAVIEEIEDIFLGLGFTVAEGPEVELEQYNFEMLNLPKDHPARDMQDTFYITEEMLMRTQTSPVQVRTLLERQGQVPVRIICPGKVYRRDDDDATHSHMFTQCEGLVVDRNVRMSDLKGILYSFARHFFNEETNIRFRPSFFPFTEPSVEVDLVCVHCKGEGCRICKHTGWIEILGAGMVHPRVLEMAGYDPREYTGFAFGMGIERMAMLKFGIDNIRNFYVNDLRFLSQFKVRS